MSINVYNASTDTLVKVAGMYNAGPTIPDGKTVTPTDDVIIWQKCAGIANPTYTTLSEVLNDTSVLSALISSNNAVDYLVRSTTWAGVQVPIMTSDNTPSGECFGSSYYNDSRYRYYRSFDGTISSTEGWNSSENSQTEYIGYDFTRDVVVTKVELACRNSSYPQRNVTLRGSHDKVTWDDISVLSSNITDTNTHTYTVSNSTAYRYYSIQSTAGNGNVVTFSYIQFYTDSLCADSTAMTYIGLNDYCANTLLADSTWRTAICNSAYFESVLNVKVPPMTDNTHPSGSVSASSSDASYPAYYAFNNSSSNRWETQALSSDTPCWISYTFADIKKILAFTWKAYTGYQQTFTLYVQGYVNGTWVNLKTYSDTSITAGGFSNESRHLLDNVVECSAYRLYASRPPHSASSTNKWMSAYIIQFYGRENGGVQTWLHAAGITNKNYTTLSEVLADTSTLSTLINNHSACDYLVTCKGWATTICADSNAMTYIGQNNYCADTLLADSTWLTAICNSAYIESVLNDKNPSMTSANAPSGSVSASSTFGSNYAYYAMDNNTSSQWVTLTASNTSQNIVYDFGRSFRPKFYKFKASHSYKAITPTSIKCQGYNNGSWEDIGTPITGISNDTNYHSAILNTSNNYTQFRWYVTQRWESNVEMYGTSVADLRIYGREDV